MRKILIIVLLCWVAVAIFGQTRAAEYRVSNTRELLDAVDTINRQGAGDYVIIFTGNISLAQNDREIRFTSNAQKTVTLRGDGSVRSLSSVQDAYLLEVPSAVTLVLGGNLRLSGTSGWGAINVTDRGTLRMETEVTITGYDGIMIDEGGTFIMNGGAFSGIRYPNSNGETICVNVAGTFTMNGGTISGNTADGNGSGVYVEDGAVFIKTGGTITADDRATIKGNVVGGSRIRNSAAGPSVRLDSRIAGSAGGWE